jgi:hypothetical protein
MISRFTLDSATEFLFGQDVCSLSAGLPYPQDTIDEKANSPASPHPADVFARSFALAQELSGYRSRRGGTWPLAEFFEDAVIKPKKVVEDFINPIIAEALNKKVTGTSHTEKLEDDDHITLLDHLVKCTGGTL